MNTPRKSTAWSALLQQPGDTAAQLMTYLSAKTGQPMPALAALLGHPIQLRSLSLNRDAHAADPPRNVDLLLWLTTPLGARVRVVLAAPLVRGLLALLQREEPLPPTPIAAGEAGLLAGLSATALTELAPPGLQLRDVSVCEPDDEPSPPSWTPALTASALVQVGPAQGELRAELDEAAASGLEQAAAQWQVEHAAAAADRPINAELVLARAPLPWQRITRAEPGDAIAFPGQPPYSIDCAVCLRIGAHEIPARLRRTDAGPEVELQGDPQATAEPDPWEPNRETIAPGAPVQLRVALGDVELTRGAVAALRPGSAIALDAPLGTAAELRSGSRTIARGTLLEVDDCLAVRLAEILV